MISSSEDWLGSLGGDRLRDLVALEDTLTMTISGDSGITAIGDEGLGQQPWWVEQWMELINGYRFKKRLERAWGYAREGNVTSIRFEGRRVHARVRERRGPLQGEALAGCAER